MLAFEQTLKEFEGERQTDILEESLPSRGKTNWLGFGVAWGAHSNERTGVARGREKEVRVEGDGVRC